jgi:hypothetical protein
MSTAGFTQASIADIAEDKVIERLLSDPLWGTELFDLAGMPRRMLNRQRVLLDTAPGNFKGDIDVLRCAPDKSRTGCRIRSQKNQIRDSVTASPGADQINCMKLRKPLSRQTCSLTWVFGRSIFTLLLLLLRENRTREKSHTPDYLPS